MPCLGYKNIHRDATLEVFVESYKSVVSWYFGVNFIEKFIGTEFQGEGKKILHGKTLRVF